MSTDVKKLIAEAQLPRRIVSVCTRGDLTAEAQRLEAKLREADTTPEGQGRLTGPSAAVEIAQELEAVREKMNDASIEFELQAFASHKWRSLKAEHPLGEKPTQADVVVGADVASLFNAAIPVAVVSPELDDEDWAGLLDALPDGEWQRLVDAVYTLNEEGTQIPFSSRAYGLLRAQSDESNSPEPSE